MPILGVCLGMQAIALAHGAQVQLAPEPVHGRVSEVQNSGHPLLAGIPSGELQAFRPWVPRIAASSPRLL